MTGTCALAPRLRLFQALDQDAYLGVGCGGLGAARWGTQGAANALCPCPHDLFMLVCVHPFVPGGPVYPIVDKISLN